MPVVVANVTILTNFVILEIPEDDNLSIILGRPFLNTVGAVYDCNKNKVTFCRVVGATYANGWLIMVGASKTSPVPVNGMRRRHARRRILPRFGALRGENTPSPTLQGLRMITRSERVATIAPRAVGFKGEEEQG